MANPPPAPLPHPLWQNFPMCPVTGSSEDGSHGTTCLLVVLGSRKNLFRARRPGPCQMRRCGKDLLCSGKVPVVELWRDFFWTQVRREGNTYPGSANTRSHFGPCNSLSCEMAPWWDWTSLTYMYGRSLWRGTYLWNTVLARFPVSNMAPVNVNKYLMSF